ncbi:hypothetical protein TNCV_1889861 [Trichonephila clavipes]|nr:hypothetical protein TNCV_1889861 [Trichonephila clavipes]
MRSSLVSFVPAEEIATTPLKNATTPNQATQNNKINTHLPMRSSLVSFVPAEECHRLFKIRLDHQTERVSF